MLVSRVASLGRLRHKPKGYSGPLSRSLLAYHSIISGLQTGLRDLVEMVMVAMFLDGSIDRDRNDWMDLSIGYVALIASSIIPLISSKSPIQRNILL